MILIRLEHLPLVPLNHGNDTFIKIYIDPGPLNVKYEHIEHIDHLVPLLGL